MKISSHFLHFQTRVQLIQLYAICHRKKTPINISTWPRVNSLKAINICIKKKRVVFSCDQKSSQYRYAVGDMTSCGRVIRRDVRESTFTCALVILLKCASENSIISPKNGNRNYEKKSKRGFIDVFLAFFHSVSVYISEKSFLNAM